MTQTLYAHMNKIQIKKKKNRTLKKRCFVLSFGETGLNSGLHPWKAGAFLLELCLQSVLFWLFWRWASLKLFAWVGLELILLISAS
jgi:hypothetical protein